MTMHPSFEQLTDAAYGLKADAGVEGHARDCAECRRALEEIGAERSLLQTALGGARMSPEGQARILAAVRRPRFRAWPVAAAALLLACFGMTLHLALEVRALRGEIEARRPPSSSPGQRERVLWIQSMEPEQERRAMQIAFEVADDPEARATIQAALCKPYFESLAKFYKVRAGQSPGVDFVKFNPWPEVEGHVRPMLPPERMRRFHRMMEDWQRDRSREVADSLVEEATRELKLDAAQREKLGALVSKRMADCQDVTFAPREVGMFTVRLALANDETFLREVGEVLPPPQAARLQALLAESGWNR
jgi:hypothetical protein